MAEKTITFHVRNFPVELNRQLRAEAALRGATLETFIVWIARVGLAKMREAEKEGKS
jgi:plasmid stability protein